MRAYIVEKKKLESNIALLKKRMGDAVIWGVLKGDGYGVGAVAMAEYLAAGGIDHFAVCDIREAEALRDAGFAENPILMMRGTCDEAELEELLDLNVTLTISSLADAAAMETVAARRAGLAEGHLKIDTGMGRFGFEPEELDKILSVYTGFDHVAVTGVYTHFHSAFDRKCTEAQFARFQGTLEAIRAAGFETGMVHCCNSTAAWRYGEMRCDAVRIGSALLGRVGWADRAGLCTLGYCQTPLEEIRVLPAGQSVGYAQGWKAKRDTTIGIVGIGWGNGFGVDRGFDLWRGRDCLRGIGRYIKAWLQKKSLYVTIQGKKCRVLGHVGMVNLVVDLTGLDCQPGEPVIVPINPVLAKGLDVVFQ